MFRLNFKQYSIYLRFHFIPSLRIFHPLLSPPLPFPSHPPSSSLSLPTLPSLCSFKPINPKTKNQKLSYFFSLLLPLFLSFFSLLLPPFSPSPFFSPQKIHPGRRPTANNFFLSPFSFLKIQTCERANERTNYLPTYLPTSILILTLLLLLISI